MIPIRAFELLLPLALIGSVAVAIVTPMPMLPMCTGMTRLADKVWPQSGGPAMPTAGALTVQPAQSAGCFRVVDAAGVSKAQACHRASTCTPTSSSPRVTAIHGLADGDGYYADVGTRCDAVCCDMRGIAFAPTGLRLDDGPLQRVWTRANCAVSSWLVPVALLWGLVSLVRRSRGTRTPSTLAGLVAGFGFPILLLWRFI